MVKKVLVLMMLICTIVLAGCGASQTIETIGDDAAAFAPEQAGVIQLDLPEGADVQVMENTDGSKLYLCDDYCVTVQVLDGGDMRRTFQTLSGYDQETLTVMKTEKNGNVCYESAWCSAGEGGDQTCRAIVLDDGAYHYAVTVAAHYTQAGTLTDTWGSILDSVRISTD